MRLFLKDPPWWFQEGVLALVIGLVLLAGQWLLDGQRAVRAEQLENLRFVRERSSDDPDLGRPFVGLDLRGQNLSGLQLVGADFEGVFLSGGYLESADLSDADFYRADLSDAFLTDADLTDANLLSADLSDAFLIDADLTGAVINFADLTGADFYRADLSDARIAAVCYSRETIWPGGFEPPPSEPAACQRG